MMKLRFMSKYECFYSSNPCLMDLGCPLLRGSSDRRLRRCAATLPLLWERTFPGSIFSSLSGAVTMAMQDLEEENISCGARHLNGMYCCQLMCTTFASCCRRSQSSGASILKIVLTGPVTADYICRRLPRH